MTQISALLGNHASLREAMIAMLPRVAIHAGDGSWTRPLAGFDTAQANDPTMALVDAYAIVADIISFYQDRILNEAYLDTALDYASLALMGRGLGEDPGAHVGAQAALALFAQPGRIVTVPAGSVVQADPPKIADATTGAATGAAQGPPIFETAATARVDPALNQLLPLQTRAAQLRPDATSLLLDGTGLGLAIGDFLLFAGPGDTSGPGTTHNMTQGPWQWMRLTVFSVVENPVLRTTLVGIGAPLGQQWTASGATVALPRDLAGGLALYALDLTCRPFGYNAPAWNAQSLAVQRAATPPNRSPAQYGEWPGYDIDLADLALQSVYPRVLPGSRLLIETPVDNRLGTIAAVSRPNMAAFGMTGPATRVVLDPDISTQPSGLALVPARTGHSATTLDDGRVLIVGGIGTPGVLDSVELYDPATGLVAQLAPLPAPRGLHSATMVGGTVYLAGGVTAAWGLARDLLRFDLPTMSFVVIPDVMLAAPRIAHAALALPDGTLLLSGGLTAPGVAAAPTRAALEAQLHATASVVLFRPATGDWAWPTDLAMTRARAGHSATLCPVSGDDGVAVGAAIVFLGGHGGTIAAPLPVWADAELTDGEWHPRPATYPIVSRGDPPVAGSARYDHGATPLPGNGGFAVTGGRSATAPVVDTWLVGVVQQDGDVVPVFVPGPPLATARSDHAAASLADGRLVVAGGLADMDVLDSVESFTIDPVATIVADAGAVLRAGPAATLPQPQADAACVALASGALLLTGGIGAVPDGYLDAVTVYDPRIGSVIAMPGPVLSSADLFVPTGSIALRDGTVLLLGATAPGRFAIPPAAMTAFAWVFDPVTRLSSITGAPATARVGATLSMLPNGTVLLAGGMGIGRTGYGALDSAEIYDPRAGTFRTIGARLQVPRYGHSATALNDGTVLVAGGFYFPPIAYDPPGVEAARVPALATAELFDPVKQAFVPVATPLPHGFALHAATLLGNGDVLITGGIASFYLQRDFSTYTTAPIAQAAIFTAAGRSFALIAPLPGPRAQHSATLLPSGKVLLAGGTIDAAMTPTASTSLFDPHSSTFAPAPPLASARHAHGAATVPGGLLILGGDDRPSWEVVESAAATSGALPIPMPSPRFPAIVSLVQRVEPVTIAGVGVFTFGGQVAADGRSSATIMLYVEPSPPPGDDARRQALVYTQSRPLTLARPIDETPVTGVDLVLTGLIDGLTRGQQLVVAGHPPLARTVGIVTCPGGAPPLAAGSVVMALAPLPAARGAAWRAVVADVGMLTIVTDPTGDPPSDLLFLSGNGGTIGTITADQLKTFARPLLSEPVTVKRIVQQATTNTTVVTIARPLANLYDRTTTSVYGNIVTVTQGSSVTDEILGSGDGETAFQAFLLKQAPLSWAEQADGTVVPQLVVTVGGSVWRRVAALVECDADAQAYQLTQDAQGRARIQFGDGLHGLRLPTGRSNVTATYRVGAGTDGNVAAGSLTRAPAHVAGIRAVLNPVAASGGIGAVPRAQLRTRIPDGVRDLGRIVTRQDMLSFVRNRPEIGTAMLSTGYDRHDLPVSLVSLAGPDNGELDTGSIAYESLRSAFAAALAGPLPHRLLPYVPTRFKLRALFATDPGADVQAVRDAMAAAIVAWYGPAALRFADTVLHAEVATRLKVGGVARVAVTALWVPTRQAATLEPMLSPRAAMLSSVTGEATGAEILSISPDADAISLDHVDHLSVERAT